MKELIKDYVNFWSNDTTKCNRPLQWWMFTTMSVSIITITILTNL
jgi:hypothetical protein